MVSPPELGPMLSMPYVIGKKIEMTQIFKDDGTVVPVTIVSVEPNIVTQVRSVETDGYHAVQLGVDERRSLPKAQQGHLKDLKQVGYLQEVPLSTAPNFKRGDVVGVEVLSVGMIVDVVGTSKGKGFAGVMKRHHFSGGPASHGQKDQMRMPGSIASQRQGPVIPGHRMAGRMGNERVTVKNLEVISVDKEKATVCIKGAVPGAQGGWVLILGKEAKTIWQK